MAGRVTPALPRPRWRDLLGVAAPLLALVSAVAYAVVRVSYERFYARFGLSPEDVGANSTTILAESGAHVLVYSLLFAVIPYGLTLWTFHRAATRLDLPLPQRFPAPLAAATRWLVVVVLALVPLAVYQELTGGGILGWYVGVVLAALVLLSLWLQLRRGAGAVDWAHLTLVWCSLGVVWLNLHYLPGAAARAGGCITNKPWARQPRALRFVHTRRSIPGHGPTAVLNVLVEPADVTWIDGGRTPPLPARLLYLGQSGGTAVLYDLQRRGALRVPAGDVVVRTLLGAAICDDTHFRPVNPG